MNLFPNILALEIKCTYMRLGIVGTEHFAHIAHVADRLLNEICVVKHQTRHMTRLCNTEK